ncbi:hypothetical protein Tco_0216184 [Tanacetum coccineum]
MIVTSDLFDWIKAVQEEALKEENWKSERIASYIPYLEDDNRGIKTHQGRIYITFRSNIKELIIEEAHKSNYHASIKMPPYEMLYGRRCRTPICWNEVGSRELASTDVVLATIEKIESIRERLREAQDRKCLSDESSVITLDDVEINPELTFQEEPVAILGRKSRQLRNKEIPLVKVEWKHRKGTSII